MRNSASRFGSECTEDMQIVLPRAFVTFFAISLLMKFALDYNDNIRETIYHHLTVTIFLQLKMF